MSYRVMMSTILAMCWMRVALEFQVPDVTKQFYLNVCIARLDHESDLIMCVATPSEPVMSKLIT